MKPNVYDESVLDKGIVDDRDGVKVEFRGGNVFRVFTNGNDEHVTVRGGKQAYARAEEIRKELDPEYRTPVDNSTEEEGGDKVQPSAEAATKAKPKKKAKKAKVKKPKKQKAKAKKAGDQKGKSSTEPAAPEPFSISGVDGVMMLAPVESVEDVLGEQAGRVPALMASDAVQRLTPRVRVTDGRCAPIFFTTSEDVEQFDLSAVSLFAGLNTFAAAKGAGMSHVCVVVMPADRVSEAQGAITSFESAALATVSQGDDEELIARVHADDE